jgi:hypothetical protein
MSLALHADSTEANEVYVWHVLHCHIYDHMYVDDRLFNLFVTSMWIWTGCTSWWEKDTGSFIWTRKLGWELKKRPSLLKVTLLKQLNRPSGPEKKNRRHFLLSEIPGINYLEIFKGHCEQVLKVNLGGQWRDRLVGTSISHAWINYYLARDKVVMD